MKSNSRVPDMFSRRWSWWNETQELQWLRMVRQTYCKLHKDKIQTTLRDKHNSRIGLNLSLKTKRKWKGLDYYLITLPKRTKHRNDSRHHTGAGLTAIFLRQFTRASCCRLITQNRDKHISGQPPSCGQQFVRTRQLLQACRLITQNRDKRISGTKEQR